MCEQSGMVYGGHLSVPVHIGTFQGILIRQWLRIIQMCEQSGMVYGSHLSITVDISQQVDLRILRHRFGANRNGILPGDVIFLGHP